MPEVGPCTVDHIHVSIGAGGVNDFNLEDTNSALDFMAVVEGIASVIEPSPASGASGATLGVAEVAKGLVEQLDKRKDMIKQGGSATIALVLQRSYCSRVVCYLWPLHQNIWKKETFDQEIEPPGGLGSGDPGKWVGANFDLRNADVRQALKDAYEKALKKCEGQ